MESKLSQHIPAHAIKYCMKLWEDYPFLFKITAKRSTKLGDYRYFPKEKSHIITVNNDLNPYSFLITYIHEVAHRVTFEESGRKVKPHGKEWKLTFKKLMLPVLNDEVFPQDILRPLAKYIKNPPATTHASAELLQALRKYNSTNNHAITLAELNPGQHFKFKKRTFEKLLTKRTRVVCREVISNRNYLISGVAEVELEF